MKSKLEEIFHFSRLGQLSAKLVVVLVVVGVGGAAAVGLIVELA